MEATAAGAVAHDGVAGVELEAGRNDPSTLVIAGCDPAVGLLADAVHEIDDDLRLLPLVRGSRAALGLLRDGLVHVAGVHLCGDDGRPLGRTELRELAGQRPAPEPGPRPARDAGGCEHDRGGPGPLSQRD
jgi:hypothetical protein